jgi:hypothetical protein
MPGGLSPWGLEAGAPPVDMVLTGPVLPCGWLTLPLGLAEVDLSVESDWERAAVAADDSNTTATTMVLLSIMHLQAHTLSRGG